MDYDVVGSSWLTFKHENKHELDEEYPDVTSQPQTCAVLGFHKEHISPLYNVQKRTFVDPHSQTKVTNAYWERGTTEIKYSVAHQTQNWCMDYAVAGPAWKTFQHENKHELDGEYPGVTLQPQTCAVLGFHKEHISPLYHVQKRTFVDPHSQTKVTNAYWERGTTEVKYSVAHQTQNWCMDYAVAGPAWKTFQHENKHDLDGEYPGVTLQPQTCAVLGFHKEHISPLYHVQ